MRLRKRMPELRYTAVALSVLVVYLVIIPILCSTHGISSILKKDLLNQATVVWFVSGDNSPTGFRRVRYKRPGALVCYYSNMFLRGGK